MSLQQLLRSHGSLTQKATSVVLLQLLRIWGPRAPRASFAPNTPNIVKEGPTTVSGSFVYFDFEIKQDIQRGHQVFQKSRVEPWEREALKEKNKSPKFKGRISWNKAKDDLKETSRHKIKDRQNGHQKWELWGLISKLIKEMILHYSQVCQNTSY